MSADRWTQCPQCYVRNKAIAEELEKLASESYGNVSAENFDELREQAISFRKSIASDDSFCSSLREDYSVGIHNGEFSVGYYASCQTCGFKFEFKHEEKVK
jgi:adenosine/AMP kinase